MMAGLPFGIDHEIAHVVVVVALAVVAGLRRQVEALGGAFLPPRGHHADARHPDIAQQRLRARRPAQLGQIEKRRQLAADAVAGQRVLRSRKKAAKAPCVFMASSFRRLPKR